MARVRDIAIVIRKTGAIAFGKKIWKDVSRDNLFTWSSAMAYSWLFAVFPFLIFLMTLLPYLPQQQKEQAEKSIFEAIDKLPKAAQETIKPQVQQQLHFILKNPPRGFGTIGVLLTLWAASGGMSMTMAALDRCYSVQKHRHFIWQRLLAIILTIIVTTLIISVVVLLPVGTLVTNFVVTRIGDGVPIFHIPIPEFVSKHITILWVLWQIARFGLAFVLLFSLIGVVYYFGPNVKQRWRWLTPGSIFTIAVWLVLGSVFRLYVDRFGRYNQTYGAAGGVVILLLFFYIDALVLLIGAELNCEVDCAMLGVEPGTVDLRGPGRKSAASMPAPAPQAPTASGA